MKFATVSLIQNIKIAYMLCKIDIYLGINQCLSMKLYNMIFLKIISIQSITFLSNQEKFIFIYLFSESDGKRKILKHFESLDVASYFSNTILTRNPVGGELTHKHKSTENVHR